MRNTTFLCCKKIFILVKRQPPEDLKPLVPRITLPTLVLWGEKDSMVPISDGYYLKESLAKVKLVIFKNEGHKLPYNKPKKIAEEIKTLNNGGK